MGKPVLLMDCNGFVRDIESDHQLLIKLLIISNKNIKEKNVTVKTTVIFY